MRHLLIGLTVLGIGAAATVGSDRPARERCDIGTPLVAPEGFRVVLGRPTPDSVNAPLHHFDWYDWAGDSFTPKPRPADSTWGQVFEAVDVLGADSLSRALQGHEFVVVPWTYDAACHPEPWDSSVVWVGEELQVFFLARSRRIQTDRGPAFDVLGWHFPYPRGSFLRFETDELRDTWLTASEYFEFLGQIQGVSGAAPLLEVMDRWREAHPDAIGFPVSELQKRYRAWRRGGEP